MRVLVSSEDEQLVMELLRQARPLQLRLTIATATNTLDQARLINPDLLILDLQQRIDGRLLLARLKQDVRTSALRVVTIAAREDSVVRRFCNDHRVAAHDLKPLSSGYLEKHVGYRSILTRSPASVA